MDGSVGAEYSFCGPSNARGSASASQMQRVKDPRIWQNDTSPHSLIRLNRADLKQFKKAGFATFVGLRPK